MNYWTIFTIILSALFAVIILFGKDKAIGLRQIKWVGLVAILALSLWGLDIVMYLNNSGTPTLEHRTIATYFNTLAIDNRYISKSIFFFVITIAALTKFIYSTIRYK